MGFFAACRYLMWSTVCTQEEKNSIEGIFSSSSFCLSVGYACYVVDIECIGHCKSVLSTKKIKNPIDLLFLEKDRVIEARTVLIGDNLASK